MIDIKEILAENLKNNRKLYVVLLQSYQKNDLPMKIQDAVSADKLTDAVHYTQALKSIVNNIGLDDLRNKTGMLEESLRAFTYDDALLDKIKSSTEETRKLIPALIIALEEGKLS